MYVKSSTKIDFISFLIVAPMFDSGGGAIQYIHDYSINQEVRLNKIREDFTWLELKN